MARLHVQGGARVHARGWCSCARENPRQLGLQLEHVPAWHCLLPVANWACHPQPALPSLGRTGGNAQHIPARSTCASPRSTRTPCLTPVPRPVSTLPPGTAHTFFVGANDKPRAGELINVLREAKQQVPEELLKFGTTGAWANMVLSESIPCLV